MFFFFLELREINSILGYAKNLCNYAFTYMDVLKQEKLLDGYIVGFLARSMSVLQCKISEYVISSET